MASIAKKIKNILYSKTTPSWLFSWYFHWKNDKKKLFAVLNGNGDLLDILNKAEKKHWLPRIQSVIDGKDNQDIPRDKDAGKIIDGLLTMHNGIKVDPLSYYSYPMLKMLEQNKGVHEPQEENIFQEVLATLNDDKSKIMLELGSYWSFYSIWFKKIFPSADCYMVEPDRRNLMYGQHNFEINKIKGTFIHGGISGKKDNSNNITTVDDICQEQQIDFLDILHSDIQGYELEMLYGSQKMLSKNKVGYAFISTHSNELHTQCQQLLQDKYGFITVASANLDESFSWDGILVMKAPEYPGIDQVNIDKKGKR
jgi:hypothetical protein